MTDNDRVENRDADDVARALRASGKREPIPADRAARMEAAARQAWQEEFPQPGRSRRWAAVALSAAATIAVLLLVRPLLTTPLSTSQLAHLVQSTVGDVQVRRTAESPAVVLTQNDTLPAGSELNTGVDGRVALRLASGHSVRVDGSSSLALRPDGSLTLLAGRIYLDSGSESRVPGSLGVHTRFGVVREIGTQFEVSTAEDQLHVRIREGEVVVDGNAGSHRVRAGSAVRIDSDGRAVRSQILAYGPEWEWISPITPMLDLNGRTVSEFLIWACRERGWTLAYSDDDSSRTSETTVASGTIDSLTIDEAIFAVLSAAGMSYSLDEGVLRVSIEQPAAASL